jgi:hypothetical protein
MEVIDDEEAVADDDDDDVGVTREGTTEETR